MLTIFLEWARELGSTHIPWHRWTEISFPYQIWTHTNVRGSFQKKNVLSNTGPIFWTAHYGNQNRMSQNNLFIDHCHNFESAWIPIIALWQNWSMLWPRSIISVALISIVSVDQQHCWALVAARAGLEYWSAVISIDKHWTVLISTDQHWSASIKLISNVENGSALASDIVSCPTR